MDSQTRQEYVRAAVGFLQNPKLVDSSLQDKLKFLRDKGLSDIEVDEALNLAIVNRHQSQGDSKNKAQTNVNHMTAQSEKIKDPLLTEDIKAQSQEVKDGPTLDEILQKIAELKRLIELQRKNFGQEVQSLKTLLLGHEKFAAPPVIPAWQLGDTESQQESTQSMNTSTTVKDNSKGGKRKGEKGKKTNAVDEGEKQGKMFNEPSVAAPTVQ